MSYETYGWKEGRTHIFSCQDQKKYSKKLVLFMDVIYLVYKIYALVFMVLICMLSYIKWWLQELHSMVEYLSKDKCKMNLLYRCIFLILVVSILCSMSKI